MTLTLPPAERREADSPEESQYAVDDRELLGIVQHELDSALGWTGTRIAEVRRDALARYFGNPRGDERDGRSSVVSRDVFEQVEWALPPLMEIFLSGNEVCRFHPQGPEDEAGAEQATDASNYVFRQQGGPMVLYTAFKDALIQKNGIVKVWWEESTEAVVEFYDRKTLLEMVALDTDPEFTVRAVTAFQVGADGERVELDPEAAQSADTETIEYDIEGTRSRENGRVKMENIPPEEFILNRDARGLTDGTCRFVGNRIPASESLLISWGFDPETVKRLPGSQSVYATDQDRIVRASQDDSQPLVFTNRKDSERTVYVSDLYIKVDRDGDGVSEWWNVIVGGEYGQELLYAAPCDGHPYCSGTPIPVPHRFYGLSLYDVVVDKENINTSLLRSVLDSANLSTDPRNIVLSEGTGESAIPLVNLEQLNDAVPGGFIEEYRSGALRPYTMQTNIAELVPLIEMQRKELQQRTGISPEAQGIDPGSISKHVYGAIVQSTAAQQRIVMFARVFAETLVTDLFRLIYKTLLQNAPKEFMIRLRGEWVPVDPSQWSHEMDCQIAVGLGHGSRMERVSNLQVVGQVQKEFAEAGLTNIANAKHLYNTASQLCEALGFKDTVQFFEEPDEVKNPAPPPEPTPEEKAIAAQQQVEMMRLEVDRQKEETNRFKFMLEAKKVELEHEREMYKLKMKPVDDPNFTVQPGVQ